MKPSALFAFLMLILTACTGDANPSATPVIISRELATVFISPTPNEEVAATRAVVTVTSIPPSATVIPTETPYVGIFVGEAEAEASFIEIVEPIFAPEVASGGEPTANAERCIANPIDAPYITAWRTNQIVSQRMGCPIQGGFGIFGESQIFENGVMYYYPELNAVWAIRIAAGTNRGEYDYLENPPEGSTIGLQAPVGLLLPGAAFGNMWLGVQGLREEMGFARTEAQTVPLGLQRFENGTFLLDASAGQVFALVNDRTVLGPYLASETTPALIGSPSPEAEITEAAQG